MEVYFNLANTLKDLNRKDEAVVNYKAINIKADFVGFTIIRHYIEEIKKLKESELIYKKAIIETRFC